MAGKQLEAELMISGDLDESLKKAIQAAADRMDEISEAANSAAGATGELSDMIKRQQKTLQAAQTQYASFILNNDEACEEAQALAKGIADLTADLNKNKSALNAAEAAAASLAKDLEGVGDGASDAGNKLKESENNAKSLGDGFTVLKGAAASLVASGFKAIVSGATQAASAIFNLAEETREYRQYMSSLETAYGQANFSAEQAKDTWKQLYAVIGDEDQAVEAANNIARMASSQQDLSDWVKISTGVWGVYEKALPIENIAEAAAETAKTGTVTGGLADALNWSTEAAEMFAKYMGGDIVTAEDAFNKALSSCSDEQERQALINETLLALYGDAGEEYKKTAGSLIDARLATADLLDAQSNLGEIIEPVTTAWTVMKTQLMEAVAPALEIVSGKLQEAMQWMQEHPEIVKALAIAFGILASAITVITVAVAAYAAVQMLANAALLPVIGIALAIAAAIAAVVAIGYLVVANWELIKEKATEVWQWVVNAWNNLVASVKEVVTSFISFLVQAFTAYIETNKAIWNKIFDTLKNIWNSIKDTAKSFASGVVDKIKSSWNSLTDILAAPFKSVMKVINSVSDSVGSLVSKAKNVGSSLVSWIPGFASGGFTEGISIAGEAGTEAVISFDPRYRADNLRYWAQAGRMLGADESDYILSGGDTTTTSVTSIENVHFSPNITITGDAKKQDIIDAIRETYPEFMDLIDEVLADREATAYA